MKTSSAVSILLFSAGASAFTPRAPPASTTLSPLQQQQQQQQLLTTRKQQGVAPPFSYAHSQASSNSKRFMSDNTGKDFQEKVTEKADELTKFLVVDVQNSRNQLANNWGWITASGALTLFLGALAFYLPLQATGIAYDATVITLGAAGVVGLANTFVRENGHKAKSGLSGLLYLGVAYYLSAHPAQGLDIMTLTIATIIGAEGIYETALAAKNKDLQGRGWHFVTGIGSTLASLWLTTSIPAASLFAPGAALGARLTSNGATKVAIGLSGKELADQRKSQN